MKKTLSGLGVEYSGTFGDLDRSDLADRLRLLGATFTNGVNTKTKLLIAGRRASSSKINKARLSGIDIIEDREQLDALLAGTPLDEVLAMNEEEVIEKQDLDEVIANIRHIVAEGPTRETWEKLVEVFDATNEEDLDPLLDYVLPYIEEWPWNRRVSSYWAMHGGDDLRAPNEAWTEQLFTGKDSKKFRAIRSLQLSSKKLVGKVAVKLFESEHLDNVRSLDIGNNKIPGTFFKQWAKNGRWPKLALLKLNNNKVNASGMTALAEATHLTELTHVYFHESGLDDKSFACFLEASHMKKLVHLDLGQNALTEESAKALANAKHLTALESLRLYNMQSGGWIEALGGSEVITHLKSLDLEYVVTTPGDWQAFADNQSTFQGLEYLVLPGDYRGTGFDEDAFVSMCAGLQALKHLNCAYCRLTDRSVEAIIQSPFASTLTHLEIHSDRITDEGLLMIAEAQNMSALEHLSVWSKKLTYEGVAAVIKSKQFPSLGLLSTPKNDKHDKTSIIKALKGAKHLSASLRKSIESHYLDK